MTPFAQLAGRGGRIDLVLGEGSTRAPLVAASEVGYSPLGGASVGSPARPMLKAVSEFMRDSPEGLWLALCEHPEAARRFALIQSDRNWTAGVTSFYASRHSRSDRIWRDFYYAATFSILTLIDEHWAAPEVVLSHPTGHGWPRDLLPTVLEAIGHFADREQPMSLSTLSLHPCCLSGPPTVRKAMSMLNAEQSGDAPPQHRGLPVIREVFDTVTVEGAGEARVFRVEL